MLSAHGALVLPGFIFSEGACHEAASPLQPLPACAYRLFVGVDIAALTAVAAWIVPGEPVTCPITIEQSAAGFASLQEHLLATGVEPAHMLIVLEATGTYWLKLAITLVQAGFTVSVINPAQAHDFAKALLKRAKTDAIDAQTLAQLAERLQPAAWNPPPALAMELEQRLQERETLLKLRQQVRNQLHALTQDPCVVASVQPRMELLIHPMTDQVAEVETEIAQVLSQDTAWAQTATKLQSINGIGLLTAAHLLVTTLHFAEPLDFRADGGVRWIGTLPTSIGNQRPRTNHYWADWQCATASRPGPGNVERCAMQSHHQGLLRPPACGRQTDESGPLCGCPKALAPGLCYRQERSAL
jgi:transposase